MVVDEGEAQTRGARRYAIDGTAFDAPPLAPGLYVVATPIGHLRDVSLRCLETLAAASLVACEDTRMTGKLLQRYGIKARMRSYDDHAREADREALLARVAEGGAVALVSDAGTPLVSDPGFRLVAEARARGLAVIPVPGPSALIAALSAAGLPTDRFAFEGFLPPKREARRARIQTLDRFGGTIALYEAPQRLVAALTDLVEILGEGREAAVARELTKSFEEIRRGTLAVLLRHFTETAPRGEIVILLAPPDAAPMEATDLDGALRSAMETMRVRDAAREVSALFGIPRSEAYARALALRAEGGGENET
ncbi:MAG: 16S rRNA (cytidine(1402)-2'-O)-methyltransferase [Pseudomonadota bacterium]